MEKNNNLVFIISLIICAIIAVWAVFFNASFTVLSNAMFAFFTVDFGWLYCVAMIIFVFFCIWLAFSKYGKITLGDDGEKPEYSTMSWIAMLFGCGMGVGLVFWGVAEPMSFFAGPASGIEPMSPEAANFAMKAAFMHWGISPWANYAIMGLALAYFGFRKKEKTMISTTLVPLMGKKLADGWLGKTIDVMAVFATVAGVVTSLGLGVMQINSGLNMVLGVPSNLTIQIVIILIISVIYIWTAASGIEKGIKLISDVNLYLFIGLMVAGFVIGPKVEILNNLIGGIGSYLQNFIKDSLLVDGYGDNSWTFSWRIFYWAWFIAWAPFVGVFIARISRGRTIRQFIMGVALVPALMSIVWFSIFGSLGLHLASSGILTADEINAIAAAPEIGLFLVLQHYPLAKLLSIVAIILLNTFFITSANSGTFVLSMLSTEGAQNPPKKKMVIWGVIQSIMAIGMMLAGGLKPLQTISIAAAFPFIFIMFAEIASLVKILGQEKIAKT
jgi:glycine betaine transporter